MCFLYTYRTSIYLQKGSWINRSGSITTLTDRLESPELVGQASSSLDKDGGNDMKNLVLILLVLMLAACASTGSAIKWDNARQVKVGMTESQVTKLMGKPFRISGVGEQDRWTWRYVNLYTGSNEAMTIIFKDGVAVDVPRIPESF